MTLWADKSVTVATEQSFASSKAYFLSLTSKSCKPEMSWASLDNRGDTRSLPAAKAVQSLSDGFQLQRNYRRNSQLIESYPKLSESAVLTHGIQFCFMIKSRIISLTSRARLKLSARMDLLGGLSGKLRIMTYDLHHPLQFEIKNYGYRLRFYLFQSISRMSNTAD